MYRRSWRPSSRAVAIGAVVTTALVAGIALVRLAGDTPSNAGRATTERAASRERTARANTAAEREATRQSAGLAAGEQGAIDAAVAYATASQRWLYFTDEQITAAIAGIASPAAAPRLARDVVADISMARSQLAQAKGRVWWLVRPLAWRVDDFGDGDARVAVWTVTVLSAAGVATPQSEFLTVTLDLEWNGNAWRVDGVRDAPGPTPVTGPHDQPWDAEPFDRALDGFTRVDGEPVR